MKNPPPNFSRLYKSALSLYLDEGLQTAAESIQKISKQALTLGLSSLDIAALHEQVLIAHHLPGNTAKKRTNLIGDAGIFFALVVTPEIKGKSGDATASLKKTIAQLSARNVELAEAKRNLDIDILRREQVETDLRTCQDSSKKTLKESDELKDQLRGLSRQIMTIQEQERKRISRELHDVIAQTLLGINVRLAALKTEAGKKATELNHSITQTQKLITKSVNIVYQFARELRPTVLDHLGLIPALHSFLKSFTTRTGVRTHLKVFAGIEEIDPSKLIVLYRVAQEALTNVGQHARASCVEITISEIADSVCMVICDDGKSFRVQDVMTRKRRRRLGLLGMRERVEMVDGSFKIDSSPDNGTTITACIPTANKPKRKVR